MTLGNRLNAFFTRWTWAFWGLGEECYDLDIKHLPKVLYVQRWDFWKVWNHMLLYPSIDEFSNWSCCSKMIARGEYYTHDHRGYILVSTHHPSLIFPFLSLLLSWVEQATFLYQALLLCHCCTGVSCSQSEFSEMMSWINTLLLYFGDVIGFVPVRGNLTNTPLLVQISWL